MIFLHGKDLEPIAPIDTALQIGYEQVLNDVGTASLKLAAQDPLARRIRVPVSFLRIWDGDEDLGYYRFWAMPREEHADGSVIQYTLQSAECTLMDTMMTGWHEIGGEGISTRAVMEYILSFQPAGKTRWALGRCDFEDYYQYNFEDVTLLEAIMSLGEVLLTPYRFVFDSTGPVWTMHLIREPEKVSCGLVYRRNMTRIRRSVTGPVVTRLYGRGYGEGDNQLTIAPVNGGREYLDADAQSMALYGCRCGVHVDTRQTDPATLKAHMEKILEGGKRPQVAYEADAVDLYRATGEDWDHVTAGAFVQVLDEGLGIPVTARVTKREKRDMENSPGEIRYVLDNSVADTAEELSEIRDKIGIHELYSQGATNMYAMQIADNADDKHPLTMRFYVPGNVLRINRCLLTWTPERFRSYVTLTASGGGSARTSGQGGGATVTLPTVVVTDTASTGGPMTGEAGSTAGYTEANEQGRVTEEAGSHTHGTNAHDHGIPTGAGRTTRASPRTTGGGAHTHDIGPHTHRFLHWHKVTATVRIPPMSFTLSPHNHTVNIPEHTHEIVYGVYESSRAQAILLRVDGVDVPQDAVTEGGELDVAPYLAKDKNGKVRRGTWHKVEFVPDTLTRISANLFFQVFIQSRGAGDY